YLVLPSFPTRRSSDLAAQRLAARPVDAPAHHVRVRVGLELPVDLRIPHRLAVADGQVDPERAVLGACLQQTDRVPAAFAETVGRSEEHTSELQSRFDL